MEKVLEVREYFPDMVSSFSVPAGTLIVEARDGASNDQEEDHESR